MPEQQNNAAHDLLGVTLQTGWKVIEKINRPEGSTGAFFSVCYKVEKSGKVSFLKAFDFAKFFTMEPEGTAIVDVMQKMLSAYKYEKDLSELCKQGYVSKVVFVEDAGEETLAGAYTISLVPYLIFDLADGDVRDRLEISGKLDFSWRLFSLHEIAVGLKQLHQIEVAHQDLKPSNILTFGSDCKIGDLGRSACSRLNGPHSILPFAGDWTYAPPEIMYGFFERDWKKRVFATDCYLLGSMVVFYFTGVSMSALIQEHLPANFRVAEFKGEFSEVSSYILDAFNSSLIDLANSINEEYFCEELVEIVKMLCYPFPEERGHVKDSIGHYNKYSLERFVTKFDLLHKRARCIVKGAA